MEFKTQKAIIGGKEYIIKMNDVDTDYVVPLTEDIITYEIDWDNWEVHAKITNPSQHTLHLASQNRCVLTLNLKAARAKSPVGWHRAGEDEAGHAIAHLSGEGRGEYRFHRYWNIRCYAPINNNNINQTITVSLPNNWWRSGLWTIVYWSDLYKNPFREGSLYTYFRLGLASCVDVHHDISKLRMYQSKSKITRVEFDY